MKEAHGTVSLFDAVLIGLAELNITLPLQPSALPQKEEQVSIIGDGFISPTTARLLDYETGMKRGHKRVRRF